MFLVVLKKPLFEFKRKNHEYYILLSYWVHFSVNYFFQGLPTLRKVVSIFGLDTSTDVPM